MSITVIYQSMSLTVLEPCKYYSILGGTYLGLLHLTALLKTTIFVNKLCNKLYIY